MSEFHSEPFIELKIDLRPETIKGIKKAHNRSKSCPTAQFPSLTMPTNSHNSSLNSSKGLSESPEEISSGMNKNSPKNQNSTDKNKEKAKKRKNNETKMLFQLISQAEADIYTEEAMLNLGYIDSDLEYPSKDEIHSFTNNPHLVDIVKKELYGIVDKRKKNLEIEKRKVYLTNHLKSNSAYLIHHKMSPKKKYRRNSFDDQPININFEDKNMTYGNGYCCNSDFQRVVESNDDRIRRVVSNHKKIVAQAVFDALRTHYQNNKDINASSRYTEKIIQTQNVNKNLNEKNQSRYEKVKKDRKIEMKKKKQQMMEKFAKDESRLEKVYNARFNRAATLRIKNEEKAQHAAVVREENLEKAIDELASRANMNSYSGSSYDSISVSALVPENSSIAHNHSPHKTKPNPEKIENDKKSKNKKVDELDLELHPEEPYSPTELIKMIAMNKMVEREVRLYGRLAEAEEAREIKKIQSQKEFERKQKVIAAVREKQKNDRLILQKRDEERIRRSEHQFDKIANDYRKFLIKRSSDEAETALRIKKMRSADLRMRKKKAEEMVEREKARAISHNEMKREKMNLFEERKLMEDLRQSRAQKERQIVDRKEEARKKARARRFNRNHEERKELLRLENEYVKDYDKKMDNHISNFKSIFSNQMERAKTDPKMLSKLVSMYEVDIDEIDAKAQKSSHNSVPLNEYIESLKDAKNEFDIKTARDIIFETTNVKIGPKENLSESYIYSDYSSDDE